MLSLILYVHAYNNFLLQHLPWTTSKTSANINLQFLDVLDQLIFRLCHADLIQDNLDEAAYDRITFNWINKCQSLSVSSELYMPLFKPEHINMLTDCTSPLMLKNWLLPFVTWLDHSVLAELVKASNNEQATLLLKQFSSLINFSQQISCYPIPAPSQLIIPVRTEYTILATVCNFNLSKASLQQVVNIRSALLNCWKITPHAIQLSAVDVKYGFVYWLIPLSVAPMIEISLIADDVQIWSTGVIAVELFPNNYFYVGYNCQSLMTSPFYFVCMDSFKVCMLQ